MSGSGQRDLPSVPIIRRNFRDGKYVSNLSAKEHTDFRVSDPQEFPKVRKKLAFSREEGDDDELSQTFDFTDKMAAFRSLIKPQIKNLPQPDTTEGNDNNNARKRSLRFKLSKLADQELSRKSFINYQAQIQMKSVDTKIVQGSRVLKEEIFLNKEVFGQRNIVKGSTDSKRRGSIGANTNSSDRKKGESSRQRSNSVGRGVRNQSDGAGKVVSSESLNQNSSVSKVLKEFVDTKKTKKKCANFSQGLDVFENKEEAIIVTNEKVFKPISKDKFDMENDNKAKVSSKKSPQRSARSISSSPLAELGSLENSISGNSTKNIHTIQSNVPHYHPAWSHDQSSPNQRSYSSHQNSVMDVTLENELVSSPIQTNVIDYLGSPTGKHDKNKVMKSSRKIIENCDYEEISDYQRNPNKSKTGSNQKRHHGQTPASIKSESLSHSKSKQRSKHYREPEEFLDLSDSSKENVPRLHLDKEFSDSDSDSNTHRHTSAREHGHKHDRHGNRKDRRITKESLSKSVTKRQRSGENKIKSGLHHIESISKSRKSVGSSEVRRRLYMVDSELRSVCL